MYSPGDSNYFHRRQSYRVPNVTGTRSRGNSVAPRVVIAGLRVEFPARIAEPDGESHAGVDSARVHALEGDRGGVDEAAGVARVVRSRVNGLARCARRDNMVSAKRRVAEAVEAVAVVRRQGIQIDVAERGVNRTQHAEAGRRPVPKEFADDRIVLVQV